MHIQHIGVAGGFQGLLRHPEGGQQLRPLGDQLLLPHRGPDVAVDDIGVLHILHVVSDLNEAAVLPGLGEDPVDQVLVHLFGQFLGAQGHEVHAHLGGADHPGVAHVVPHIAGKDHLDLVQGLVAVLLDGQHVRQNLGGMVGVGQAVPHGHARPFRQVLHHGLLVAPVLDAVEEAAQDFGGVLQGLLFAHLGAARVQVGDVGALLGGRHLEGAAGAGGGLFKQQHNVLAFHRRLADARPALGLQVPGQVQQITNFLRGKIFQSQKAPAFQIHCHGDVSFSR